MPYGIGLVKLMGRHAGFIAATAALASGNANFCLIPEVEFTLDGGRSYDTDGDVAAETLDEERFCLETFGARPVQYAEDLGWAGDDVWFAHGVFVDTAEIEEIRQMLPRLREVLEQVGGREEGSR